jgi:signal transduction histidine kinase
VNTGLAFRIAVVGLASAALAILILALGVVIVGGEVFTQLMVEAGDSAEDAREMFDHSIRDVLVLTVVVAGVASVALAMVLARRLARPLRGIGAAARQVAAGDYGARVPRSGPDEVASLADSFNQMATSLEEGERLRRDLIANTAHELRTPLTNLTGYLEGLRDGVVAPEPETYHSLLEETERLSRLASSLDDLAVGDRAGRPAHPTEVDLAAQLAAAAEIARPGLEAKGIDVVRSWPSVLRASADPDQLAQVLGNLLQNAARYTQPGGRVTISATEQASTVEVSVVNSGNIPAADLPHLFERFYRVEKSRDRALGGAGIGLAIVKQLVEGWGGRVGAESGAGTTRFWFSLPLGSRDQQVYFPG